jgi:hypothetical protein
MQIGEPFNPYGVFHGVFIPEALVRSNLVSAGAKLAYGRLVRYGGQKGLCFPAVETLGAEIGVGRRQAQKYVAELEGANLIRRVMRFVGGAQISNSFEFLWHPLFEQGANISSREGVNDDSHRGANDGSHKESHSQESHSEESHHGDLDNPPTNRKNRDSRLDSGSPAGCRQYPLLREALADYMMLPDDEERVYPADRVVVDVMDAAGGATEDAVLECMRYLREERGLRPGRKNGPRHFAWFKTVVADYFGQKRDRDLVTGNSGSYPAGLAGEQFDAIVGALE